MKTLDRLIEWLVARSKKKHSVFVRTVAMLFGATLFIAGMPACVFLCAGFFDKELVFPLLFSQVASSVCFVIGLPWVIAAVLWQLIYGKGTPVPAVPTKNFLQNGPYRYVRNPMILGFFIYLTGWAFLFNQPGAFFAVGFIILLLFCEIKFIEERELEERFGSAYSEYKKEMPFLLPTWRKKQHK